MSSDEPTLPASIVRRAASIARGPHACPNCESPTWAEPPVPWTALRDYVVRCDACERPITVRVDRERLMRRRSGGARPAVATQPGMYDAVSELLDRRDRRAFWSRVLSAAPLPLLLVAIAAALGAPAWVVGNVAAFGIVAGALVGPSLLAAAWGGALELADDAARWGRAHRSRPAHVVEVEAGRWDQWQREQRQRGRERAAQPEAVLRELERVLDERELRRVRSLLERGEVPPAHLDDLLRFRRAWGASVA